MRKCLMAAAVGLGFAASAIPAQASVVNALAGNPTTAKGGLDYTYEATLSADERRNPTTSPVLFPLDGLERGTLTGDSLTKASGYAQAEAQTAAIDDVQAAYPIASVAVLTLPHVVSVPEPASLMILGAGLAGIAIRRRRRAAV